MCTHCYHATITKARSISYVKQGALAPVPALSLQTDSRQNQPGAPPFNSAPHEPNVSHSPHSVPMFYLYCLCYVMRAPCDTRAVKRSRRPPRQCARAVLAKLGRSRLPACGLSGRRTPRYLAYTSQTSYTRMKTYRCTVVSYCTFYRKTWQATFHG